MNTKSKRSLVLGVAISVVSLLSGPAAAGGQTHRLPAGYGKTYPIYEIRIVNVRSGQGGPLTVQVVNKDTGELITNAEVTMRHRRWLGIKAVPQYQGVQLALRPDGRGDYVCPNGPLNRGDKIVLSAHVPGEPSSTWLIVD
ncbi:MAG: hypothetical protein KGJ78_13305 [Alphaproteobacteria bacterium]|nr:hypothetical protein [Alphaproteobacteria bacterium]